LNVLIYFVVESC